MNRNPLLKLSALFAVFALAVAACSSSTDDAGDEAEKRASDGILTIATLLPTTGQLASFGPDMIKAVQFAVQEVNAAGGVLGKDVKLEANADTGTDPDTAGSAADSLLSNANLNVIIGAAASGVSSAVVDKIGGDGVGQCSPSNTAADLSGDLYWRTAPSDDLQGPALAEFVISDGHTKVSILARADDYGKGLAGTVKDSLESSGATVPEFVTYDPEGSDFSADVSKMKGADAVVLIAFPEEGAKVEQEMIKQGIGPADMPQFTADGLQADDFGKVVDPSNPNVVDGIKGTAPSAGGTGSEGATFEEGFKAFDADAAGGAFTPQAYDCVVATALAAEAAQSDDAEKIKAELPKITGGGGEKCTDFASCKKLLDQGEEIDYDGASGALEFQSDGNPGEGTYEKWQFANADVETIGEPFVIKAEAGSGGETPEASPTS